MSQNYITPFTISAVNKIASENGKLSNPPYKMKHIPNEWMIFEYSEWCYIPLKDGVKRINESINRSLIKYGLSTREIHAYDELLAVLGIEPNPIAKSKPKKTK